VETEGATCPVYPAPPAPQRVSQLLFFLGQTATLDQHMNSSKTHSVCLFLGGGGFEPKAKAPTLFRQKCLNNKKGCFPLCFLNKQKTPSPLLAKIFHFHQISAPQPTHPTNGVVSFAGGTRRAPANACTWAKQGKKQLFSQFSALQPGVAQRGSKRWGFIYIYT